MTEVTIGLGNGLTPTTSLGFNVPMYVRGVILH